MFKRFFLTLTQTILFFLLSLNIVSAQSDVVVVSKAITGPLFVADDVVLVSEDVSGAVFAAGSSVTIAGNVSQDVVAAGGTIRITGQVDQDVYAAGGSVFIDGVVKGNVIVAGGEVQLGPQAQVGGAMMSAGERLGIGGRVMGPLYAGGQNINLNGSVAQDVKVGGEKLVLGSAASIGGTLTGELSEWSGVEVASVAGGTKLHKIETRAAKKETSWGGKIAKSFYRFAWRTVTISFVLFLVPQVLRRGTALLQKESTRVFMTGVVVVFGLPFLMLALTLTIIGVPLAVLAILAYLILLLLAWMIPSFWVGRRLLPDENEYIQGILGVAIIVVLSMIPIVGALFQLVLAAFGVGALVLLVKQK